MAKKQNEDTDPRMVEVDGVTVPGEAIFPHLRTPDTKFDADGIYSVKLALDGDSDEAQALKSQIDELMQGAYDYAIETAPDEAKRKRVKKADAPYTEEVDKDTGELTGRLLFGFKRPARVTRKRDGKVFEFTVNLFDAQRNELPDGVDVGFGSTIKVAYVARPFYTAAVGAGVSMRLEAVQVLDLKQRGRRSATSFGFDEEEGYTAPGSEFAGGEGDGAPADDEKSPI